MTVQEAIELHLKPLKERAFAHTTETALTMAIESMEEVEQYRALGTVEEIKKKIKTELPYMSLAQARFKSELDDYRNLGTVEELKEARGKQIAKKPIIKTEKERPITHNLGRLLEIYCPVCGKRIFAIYESDLKRGGGVTREAKGCSRCLQAIDFTGYYYTPKLDKSDEDIDWSEEDD